MKDTRIPLIECLNPKNWDRVNPAFLVFFIAIIVLVVGIIVDTLEFLIGGAAVIIAIYTAYLLLKFKE